MGGARGLEDETENGWGEVNASALPCNYHEGLFDSVAMLLASGRELSSPSGSQMSGGFS